ncbi:MAG: hypothetical protein AAF715_04360 [Myxococcota bacterium]
MNDDDDDGRAFQTGRRKGGAIGGLALLASVAAGAAVTGCESDDSVATVECESIRSYYANEVHALVFNKCSACHNAQGAAANSGFLLVNPAESGFIEKNIETIRRVAGDERDGISEFLLKPTNEMTHGGGQVIDVGDDDYQRLLGMVVRLQNEQVCEPNDADVFTGTELLDAEATLRKAAIILAGRLPSAAESERVRAGGFPALEAVLDEMMTEEKFYEFVKRAYGDMFQTDFYLNNEAEGRIADVYANADWFDNDVEAKAMVEAYGLNDYQEVEMFTRQAIAREPLELIEWVVKNDLPFSEVITADYMMFSPFSARSYGVADQIDFDGGDPMEFKPGRLPAGDYYGGDDGAPEYQYFPHAGVLTSPMFLSRWPSTATNRNRARARVFIDFFMGTDILKTAEQPLDQPEDAQNPTRDDPNCTNCHAKLDPIAGAFQAWDDDGIWDPNLNYIGNRTEEGDWFPEMFPPGIGDARLDEQTAKVGLPWLANQIVDTDGFRSGVVYALYEGLTGREILVPPSDFEDPNYAAQFDSFLAQANTFRSIADAFGESDLNAKTVVKELVLSPYFRAVNAVEGMSEADLVRLGEVGLGKLLAPEQLHDKILAIFGVPWAAGDRDSREYEDDLQPNLRYRGQDLSTVGPFQLFYGGVDFDDVSVRIKDPNGLMAAVAERMSNEMSCLAVPADFARAGADRKIFDLITIEGREYDPLNLAPESGGLDVPAAIQGIRQTIVRLHEKVLGERLKLEDPEVERTYQLFLETWREGTAGMALEQEDEGYIGTGLPGPCRVENDYWTGLPLEEDQQITDDEDYIIRSWMAVMTYLLSDYRFLYE